mmetsp:Transcript_14301/g.32133  ORF Transcript_14301/g.32133 Transcript_14301/m.32133 type:complete len:179 (+) Transcript_14301:1213-1749(+)
MYEQRMGALSMHHVAVCTMWLDPDDYPRLLGTADLGVCLHTSTSGLDLPMKVLDMFGSGLPVCAVGFQCLPELLQHEVNGLVFHDRDGLTSQLIRLLSPTEPATLALASLRAGVADAEAQRPRWAQNWHAVALPLLQQVQCGYGGGAPHGLLARLLALFALTFALFAAAGLALSPAVF